MGGVVKTLDPSETERPRGILTVEDRQYLLGELTYDDRNNDYQRRRRIRERVLNGILDLALVSRALPLRELELLMKNVEDLQEGEIGPIHPFLLAHSEIIALFYEFFAFGYFEEEDPDFQSTAEREASWYIKRALEDAILRFGFFRDEYWYPVPFVRISHGQPISFDNLPEAFLDGRAELPDEPPLGADILQSLIDVGAISRTEAEEIGTTYYDMEES